MKIIAEQFVFPFVADCQLEFHFIPSASVFDGWGPLCWFSFWAVLQVHSVRLTPSVWCFRSYALAIPFILDSVRRSATCVSVR